MTYIIEIIFSDSNKKIHMGYINKKFNSKFEACCYYDKYNPHMRSLNTNNKWCSDIDPKTNCYCIIKEYNGEILNVDFFR